MPFFRHAIAASVYLTRDHRTLRDKTGRSKGSDNSSFCLFFLQNTTTETGKNLTAPTAYFELGLS